VQNIILFGSKTSTIPLRDKDFKMTHYPQCGSEDAPKKRGSYKKGGEISN
jgi:hypothetical protein